MAVPDRSGGGIITTAMPSFKFVLFKILSPPVFYKIGGLYASNEMQFDTKPMNIIAPFLRKIFVCDDDVEVGQIRIKGDAHNTEFA